MSKGDAPQGGADDDDSSSDFGPAPAAQVGGEGEGESAPAAAGASGKPAAPKRRRVLKNKKLILDELPCEELYEKSYMHRDTLSQVLMSHFTSMVMTCSVDGILKFWKKAPRDIIPVKIYRPHMGPYTACVSHDGKWLATRAHTADRKVKIFDVINFDMINMIDIPFAAGAIEFIHPRDAPDARLAIAEAVKPVIHVYDTAGTNVGTHTLPHDSRITHMRLNPLASVVVSVDADGVLEYWSNTTFEPPTQPVVSFKNKMATDLFALAREGAQANSLEISKDGSLFSIMGSNKLVYIFRFSTGKQYRIYDETIMRFVELQNEGKSDRFKLEELDFGKRLATEKEMEKSVGSVPPCNAVFDESGNFLLYSTMLGVKVLNLVSSSVECILGRLENTERFLSIAMFQGKIEATQQMLQQVGKDALEHAKHPDPTVFALAWRRPRFYLLTRHEPADVPTDDANAVGRDVFNEKPSAEDMALMATTKRNALGSLAIIRTTMGDIHIQLFPDDVPKTIENFVGHCKAGYYNNLLFHRVVKDHFVQTGCPNGDGTGGESIWGGEFQDEFCTKLRHDRPFTVSMANRGPNTNGSQFFITVKPTDWLDNVHTVFGRVTKGTDVVKAIEAVRTIPSGVAKDKPVEPIRIVNIEIQ